MPSRAGKANHRPRGTKLSTGHGLRVGPPLAEEWAVATLRKPPPRVQAARGKEARAAGVITAPHATFGTIGTRRSKNSAWAITMGSRSSNTRPAGTNTPDVPRFGPYDENADLVFARADGSPIGRDRYRSRRL